MNKWSPQTETTRKTKQDRSCWKILTLVKVNSQQSTIGMLTYAEVTLGLTPAICGRCVWHVGARVVRDGDDLGAWGAWSRVTERGGAWSACTWGRNFSWRVRARVRWFLAVLGWVFLGIVCSITLCLCFSSWMSRTMRSESYRLVGVTTVTRF